MLSDGSKEAYNPTKDLNNFFCGLGLFDGSKTVNKAFDGWHLVVSAGTVGTVSQRAYDLSSKKSKYRNCSAGNWGTWIDVNYTTESYVDGKFEASSKSLLNGINFQENLTRTYQLEWGKAYLVTVNAVDSGNAVIGNNSGVFFVFTAVDAGRSSSVKELWNAGYLTVSVNSNCVLSIQGAYKYLHYSITRL